MNNHYVFLRPGERIFILTDDVAGDNDYTHVIEVEIPVHPVPDYDDSPRHRIAPEIITARRHAKLELNECANPLLSRMENLAFALKHRLSYILRLAQDMDEDK